MNNDITKKKPSKMPERVLGTEEIQRCLRHSYSTFTDGGKITNNVSCMHSNKL